MTRGWNGCARRRSCSAQETWRQQVDNAIRPLDVLGEHEVVGLRGERAPRSAAYDLAFAAAGDGREKCHSSGVESRDRLLKMDERLFDVALNSVSTCEDQFG